MKNKARFIIIDTFKLTIQHRKALIVMGDIAEGFVTAGDTIEFTALGKERRFKIKGIEFVDFISQKKAHVGLPVECSDDIEIEELSNWQPNNTEAVVYPNPSYGK